MIPRVARHIETYSKATPNRFLDSHPNFEKNAPKLFSLFQTFFFFYKQIKKIGVEGFSEKIGVEGFSVKPSTPIFLFAYIS